MGKFAFGTITRFVTVLIMLTDPLLATYALRPSGLNAIACGIATTSMNALAVETGDVTSTLKGLGLIAVFAGVVR